MVDETEVNPDEPRRVRAFAHFFKRYMSLSSVITAALPIPVTAFGLIPTFKVHTGFLSTYTPLFCFLLLGFIFYSRHQLARLMFPEYFGDRLAYADVRIGARFKISGHYLVAILPAILIGISLACIFEYHQLLDQAIAATPAVDSKEALLSTSLHEISNSQLLILYYLGIFLAAEAAFIVMAIKEYLQDLVGLSEFDLIRGPKRDPNEAVTTDNEQADKLENNE